MAPQVTPIQATPLPQNRPSSLFICLPRSPEMWGPPSELEKAGDQDGCPRVPIFFLHPGSQNLRCPCQGRKRAQSGEHRTLGWERRGGRVWGGGQVSLPPRRGLGDSSAPAARVRSGAARRRGRRKGTAARGFYQEAAEATHRGGWKNLGPWSWGHGSKGLGLGLSSRAGAAQPTFPRGSLPPT